MTPLPLAAILKVWRQSKIWLRQLVHIYLNNNPVEFHPDPIWNDGAFRLFLNRSPQQEQKQDEQRYKISSWSKAQQTVSTSGILCTKKVQKYKTKKQYCKALKNAYLHQS